MELHDKEKRLIKHYDDNPNYQSVPLNDLEHILHRTRIRPTSVLDLGCGDGRAYEVFRQNYDCEYLGIDYSTVRIQIAKDDYPRHPKATFICDSVYNWYKYKKHFDLVIAIEVLEHLMYPEQLIDSLPRPIIGSVPFDMPYEAHLQVYADASDAHRKLKFDSCLDVGSRLFMIWSPGKNDEKQKLYYP